MALLLWASPRTHRGQVGPRPGDAAVPLVQLLRRRAFAEALGLLQKASDSGVHLALLEVRRAEGTSRSSTFRSAV